MIPDNLPFIHNQDKIIDVNLGHSTAQKWLIIKQQKKFFLKCVYNQRHNNSKIYSKINSQLNVLPAVIDEYLINDKHYTLFEYKEGLNFDDLSIEQSSILGAKVGKALLSMSKIQVDVTNVSLEKVLEECMQDINYFFEKRTNPFNITKHDFVSIASKTITSFEHEQPALIHGDIKPANIIFDENSFCFIDTDDMMYSYFAFNFQYTIQMLFNKDKRYSTFMKSVINNYYENIPSYFYENIKFILIKKFFNRVNMLIHANDIEGENNLIKEFKFIFENYNNLNNFINF